MIVLLKNSMLFNFDSSRVHPRRSRVFAPVLMVPSEPSPLFLLLPSVDVSVLTRDDNIPSLSARALLATFDRPSLGLLSFALFLFASSAAAPRGRAKSPNFNLSGMDPTFTVICFFPIATTIPSFPIAAPGLQTISESPTLISGMTSNSFNGINCTLSEGNTLGLPEINSASLRASLFTNLTSSQLFATTRLLGSLRSFSKISSKTFSFS
mmetsp:Transcript_27989/g.41412  ORF Transcript_27989/g.41412 Transcript_27989/m.41412 type:complete len:210 (+) Transcript_27989:178-807(+)